MLNPGRWLWGQALLVAVTGAAVFGVGYLAAGWLIGLAAFIGSWNVMLEQSTPGAHRRLFTPLAGGGLACSAAIGFLLSATQVSQWTAIGVQAVLATFTYYVCSVLRAAPPGGFLYLLACSLCSQVPADLRQVPVLFAAAATGAVAGWLMVLTENAMTAGAAEYRAVAYVYECLATLVRATGNAHADAASVGAPSIGAPSIGTPPAGTPLTGTPPAALTRTAVAHADTARHAAVAALAGAHETLSRGGTRRMRRTGEWARLLELDRYAVHAIAAAGSAVSGTPRATLDTQSETAARIARLLGRRHPRGSRWHSEPAGQQVGQHGSGQGDTQGCGQGGAPACGQTARRGRAYGRNASGHPASAAVQRLDKALSQAEQAARTPAFTASPPSDRRRYPPLRAALAAGVRAKADAWRYAVRAGAAIFTAGALSHLAGLDRPGWAMISAGSVLLAPDLAGTFNRSLQRCAGTALGLVLAAGVLTLHPPRAATIVIVAGVVGLAQPFLAKNSGLAMLVLTPGILPLSATRTQGFLPLLDDRLWTTVIGAAVALLAAPLLRRRPAPDALRAHLASLIRTLAADTPGASRTPGAHTPHDEHDAYNQPGQHDRPGQRNEHDWRRAVLTASLDLGKLFRQALSDIRPAPSVAALWPAHLALQRLGFALAATPTPPDGDRARHAFGALATAAAEGRRPAAEALPADWADPAARESFRRLRAALSEGTSMPAEHSESQLRGRLQDPTGTPVAHATLTLIDPAGAQADVAYTDSGGQFVLHARRPGRHLVVASGSLTGPCAEEVRVPSGRMITIGGSAPKHTGDRDDTLSSRRDCSVSS
ncbi:hypothetical protein G3I19_00810 [Streptomyces sp. SID10853]|uniref:FUSC family protein n=1 Tax=Streptomyces sp. SID10853 TaxID=2706028 RepID=UPI0013C113D2|nr:FUSC family protein [Streptomyces sp. SID10853]NDZ77084.1 hypothetical protein [Streptomyces sp. SID10853]